MMVIDFPISAPGDLPDIHDLTSDLQRCLWLLQVSKEVRGVPWLTPGDLEVAARDTYGILVPRQRALAILNAAGSYVSKKRVSGRFHYQVMRNGVELLREVPQSVTFIDPVAALSHIRAAEDLFRELTGVVKVCDPYVDGRTLDFLAEADRASEIRLLTANVQKPNPLKRDLVAFRSQHSQKIEVRIAAPGLLHDRYVMDAAGLLIFGTSLNSFSRKQSFVIRAGNDIKNPVESAFDAHWGGSGIFP